MKTAWPKLISVIVPYVAVLIGLYILKNAWITIGLYHLGITVFLIADDRNRLRKRVCTGWNPIMAAVGVVMSAMIFPIIFFFWGYMQLENMPLDSALANFGLYGTSWFFFMIYFSTMQPFLEELYWRGYLEDNHKYFSWTDFAFAGYHVFVLAFFIKLPWLILLFIVVSATAWGWRRTAHKFKGLAIPLLSHTATDVSIIAVVNLLAQQF